MKKRICAILLIPMFITMPALGVCAEENVVITTATQQDASNNEVDVDEDIREELESEIPQEIEEIKISTADEFMEFANNCLMDTWSANKKVTLCEDISLLGKEFTGIPQFAGYFEGMGHTISEVNMGSGMSDVALFIKLQKTGVINNLVVSGTIIPAGEQIRVAGIVADNYGLINNCRFIGVVSANDYVGGIAGINELSGDIRNCSVSGYVKGLHFTGGIAGENIGNIANCTNTSLVNTTNEDTQITVDSMSTLNKVLGLIKNANSDSDSANADVTVSDAGGIAGLSYGVITRCTNEGTVGYEHVGYNIGGIVGRQSGYVYGCINNADILGRKDVGGIAGQAEPYITVDLSSDIAYQLTEAISKLHDTVTVTLNDTRNQSGVISNRLAAIEQFTAGAIEDVRYIATGTVDFANGVSSATSEAFSRVEYVLDEASKNGGALDNASSAADNFRKTTGHLVDTVEDLGLEQYMTEGDRQKYTTAKNTLESISSQYASNYGDGSKAYYNYYIQQHKGERSGTSNLEFSGTFGTDTSTTEKFVQSYNVSGNWNHVSSEEQTPFPVTDTDDERYLDDKDLNEAAAADASTNADSYAKSVYQSPVDGNTGELAYTRDLANASAEMEKQITTYSPIMADHASADAAQAMKSFNDAANDLNNAGNQTKAIIKNVAGRDNISFPQFSAEYKAHTTSLADNMAGMNDNFGLLNQEMNNATGVLVDDLQAMADQFNNIMMLYTDAVDGVLDMDYTSAYEDISLDEALECMDATVDGCINYGNVNGDIDISGIAGTMAIDYEYDAEGDVTGFKNSRLSTAYLTKCVLRGNKNYGNCVSEKSYCAGVCGRQEMGTIINCTNMGNASSNSGEYVGGICGSSLSYIVGSGSRGILEGTSYVGGIAGEGTNLRDCTSIVKIQNAERWYGAIAGYVSENGEVRNNKYVSDKLAGIDRSSYALKAEPVVYNENDLPYDFSVLGVTFVLEDDDLEGGSSVIRKIGKRYGEKVDESEYPDIPGKDGCYVVWDIDGIDRLTTDEIVTASYVRYRTTISEKAVDGEEKHQCEVLVDGDFKEEDYLEVEYISSLEDKVSSDNLSSLDDLADFETLSVKVPDDGSSVHVLRYKPSYVLEKVLGDYDMYKVEGEELVPLKSLGTDGAYKLFEVDGNEFELQVKFHSAKGQMVKMIAIGVAIVVAVIVILILIIVFIKRHGGKLPGFLNNLTKKISKKIKSKEQLFYDDTNDEDKKE